MNERRCVHCQITIQLTTDRGWVHQQKRRQWVYCDPDLDGLDPRRATPQADRL